MNDITCKAQMYDALQRGLLGNYFRWESYFDWCVSCGTLDSTSNWFSIRFGRAIGAPWAYRLTAQQVVVLAGDNPYRCPMSEVSVVTIPADAMVLIQGEVARSEYFLDLTYSLYPAEMRVAFAHQQLYAQGVTALSILHHFMDPVSIDALWGVLDTFHDHVVEFTVFDRDCGQVAHRNTVIWEVRRY